MPNPTGIELDEGALQRLEQARQRKGLSINALAEACEVAQPTMHNVFKGARNPSPAVLTAICDVLGLAWEQPAVRIRAARRR